MSIYRRALAQNMMPYPGDHDWKAAALYYLTAVRLCAGWTVVALGIAGSRRRHVQAHVLAGVLHRSSAVCSTCGACTRAAPRSSFRRSGPFPTTTRVTRSPRCRCWPSRVAAWCCWRPNACGRGWRRAIVIAAAAPWFIHSQPNDWVTWKESQLNSIPRRAWTKAAASSLGGSYHRGQGIITSFSDLTGILREAGIPLRGGPVRRR